MDEPVCQGCGKILESWAERHTYEDCLTHIRLHPEDFRNVTVERLYYGEVTEI